MHPTTPVVARALAVAITQIGVREQPPGSNRGPEVNGYLRSVGSPPGHAWCAAFVYWCYEQASIGAGVRNPCPRTAGVRAMWARSRSVGGAVCLPAAGLQSAWVRPGMLFARRGTGWTGHIGFVETVSDGFLTTIEGNTNDGGSREGVGVYRRRRPLSDVTLGVINYSACAM